MSKVTRAAVMMLLGACAGCSCSGGCPADMVLGPLKTCVCPSGCSDDSQCPMAFCNKRPLADCGVCRTFHGSCCTDDTDCQDSNMFCQDPQTCGTCMPIQCPTSGQISFAMSPKKGDAPFSSVMVTVKQVTGTPESLFPTPVDSSGRWEVVPLVPGIFDITAVAPGFSTQCIGTSCQAGGAGPSTTAEVTCTPGRQLGGINFVLTPQ